MTRLRTPILCMVTDPDACLGRPIERVVAEAVEAGVGMVQLRGKGMPARELFLLGRALLEPVRRGEALLVVNDRADVALALGADGVHLGGGSLPVGEVRRILGPGRLIGVSVHSVAEALDAERDGADYLVLGTIFETRSHPGLEPAGLGLVSRVARSVGIPVIAIGGIHAGNAASVMEAGARGVAVITAIQSAPDVGAATRALLAAMGKGTGEHEWPGEAGADQDPRPA